jgi:hypothetical protein
VAPILAPCATGDVFRGGSCRATVTASRRRGQQVEKVVTLSATGEGGKVVTLSATGKV